MSEKKKFRFNILDVIIILVVVACVVSATVRYSLPKKLGIVFGGKNEATVTFFVENVKTDITRNSMIEGDKFYSSKHNCYFGELVNVSDFKYDPYVVYKPNEDGIPTYSAVNHRSNVTGYLKVKGSIDEEKGFMLNNTEKIAPGERLVVYSLNRRMTITIVSIDMVQ